MLYARGDIAIGKMSLYPARKKPCLVVKQGNEIIKVASFNSEDTADWFMEKFAQFLGIEVSNGNDDN